MKRRLFLSLTVSTLAVGALATSGCNHQVGRQSPPPAAVTVTPVEQKEIVEWNEFTGRTEPVESVEILSLIHIYGGKTIRPEQPMFPAARANSTASIVLDDAMPATTGALPSSV